MKTLALVAGIVAEGLLTAGGFPAGALAYVYGVRVLKQPDAPIADALVPGRGGHDDHVLPEPGAHGSVPVSAQDTQGRRKERS